MLSIEQKDFGTSDRLQQFRDFLIQIFENWVVEAIGFREGSDFSEGILPIGINRHDGNSPTGIFVGNFLHLEGRLLRHRTFGSEYQQHDQLIRRVVAE